ncbi:MAG TPA: PHP domain-containing protein [Candidatus Avisuccinivibrio pullicola]|nr:PHP domain-containing protein [Candidatus Avisuccinivibrio pullicola]
MRYHDSTIDLHTHTTASDGAFTPEALVERARSKGITHLAITDHDTTLGIARAMARAKQDDLLGQIQIIPGVEISTSFKTVQIHIAGLFIDPDCEVMKRFVERQLSLRKWRAEEMGRKLEGAGFPHIYEEITEGLPEGSIVTRGNFARYIYEKGKAKSFEDAFNRYLRRGRVGYVNSQWMDIQEAVEIIHQAGGIAVLAHPRRYEITNGRLRTLITYFREAGGEAMEVAACQMKPSDRDFMATLCVQYGLLGSAGSDFHHEGSFRELGWNLSIPGKVTPVFEEPRFKGRFEVIPGMNSGRGTAI